MASKIRLPDKDFVAQWKEEKVIKWLKRVHLDDCIPAFESRHIDGIKLLELTEQKLFTYQDLKIKHRKQIAKCVQECKSQASNAKKIARTIKHRRRSQSDTLEPNGDFDSEEDYDDDWGSDFESDDEEKSDSQVSELNNNTIIHSSCDTSEQISNIDANFEKPVEKSIPQPPDVPVIPTTINGSTLSKSNHVHTIPRPPVKRPPVQPPPPPVAQVPSQDLEQEDYEIPIVSTAPITRENSEFCDSSFHCVISSEFNPETYELIEPPEETYEIVDAPSPTPNIMEKPVLPPRIPITSKTVSSPPPLPQKPKKLRETMVAHEKPDGIRTFTRPKPSLKNEAENEPIQSPTVSNISFIGTLMGRKPSITPPSSSPVTQHKVSYEGSLSSNHSAVSSDGLSSRSSSPDKDGLMIVGRSSFITTVSAASPEIKKTMTPLPPLPPRGVPPVSDETAQNMATRPLPPVPVPKESPIEVKPTISNQENVQSYPWYHEIERQEAEEVVRCLNESGAFVVRPSKRAGIENPFSLTIFHDEKIFHLNIRHRPDDTFALGKEKKKEKTFAKVADLIAYHQKEPILLTSRGEPAGKTILCKFPHKT